MFWYHHFLKSSISFLRVSVYLSPTVDSLSSSICDRWLHFHTLLFPHLVILYLILGVHHSSVSCLGVYNQWYFLKKNIISEDCIFSSPYLVNIHVLLVYLCTNSHHFIELQTFSLWALLLNIPWQIVIYSCLLYKMFSQNQWMQYVSEDLFSYFLQILAAIYI